MKQKNKDMGCGTGSGETARWTKAIMGIALAIAAALLITAPNALAADSPSGPYASGDVTIACTCSQCLPGAECDRDRDGYVKTTGICSECPGCGYQADCNDNDSKIKPGAIEICDGKDNDCNLATTDGSGESWYGLECDGADTDLCMEGIFACASGNKTCTDKTNGTVEVCNGLDDDCDGQVDENLTFDADKDGYTSINSCEGSQDDCNDQNPAINPGAQEICNGIDDDCDGTVDGDSCSVTRPCGDGLDLCEWSKELPLGSPDPGQCRAENKTLGYNTYWPSPSATTVTCAFDGTEHANHTMFISIDNDIVCTLNGQPAVNLVHEGCVPEDPRGGFNVTLQSRPGDNVLSCQVTDRGYMSHFDACVIGSGKRCLDEDGDGYYAITGGCQLPPGANPQPDCDDQNPDVHPGAEETCNGIDDNCNGQADENLTFDADKDGYTSLESCQGSRDDCDDNNAQVHPGATEVCNGMDDDCDGQEDEGGDSLCSGLDRYDNWTHYCDQDTHARHRLFHDYSCEGTGGCVEDAYYANESVVEDCGGKGGVMNDCGILGWSCSEEFNGVHCLISDIQADDTRCQTVCSADTLRRGVCTEWTYRCGFEDEDCNQYNSAYCNGTILNSVDYTCGQGACIVQGTTPQNCDNGLWCDGAESCSAGECLEGNPRDCSDSVSCTEDSCNEANDSCTHAADDSLCETPGDCRNAVCDLRSGCNLTINTGYVFDPPTCGLGECASQYYCDIAGGDTCTPGTPTQESCDGLDNDCDGATDEAYPNLGGACTAGTGACQDTGTYVCAQNGSGTVCDASAGSPTQESCGNGVDDDCDGKTDCLDQDCIGAEECLYERPCGEGLDLCAWSETLPLGSEDKSSCNLRYNTVWPSPSDRTVTCIFDGTENSNHTFYFTVDNDVVSCRLNGNEIIGNVVHEGCAAQDPRSANAYKVNASEGMNNLTCVIRDRHVQSFFDACVIGAGVRCPDLDQDGYRDAACGGNDCDDSDPAVHPGAAELCNGADDNCNGQTDETFANKGQSCTAGVGVCQASGTYVCAANGLNTVCDAQAGAPTGEDDNCNGLDEDCSGSADDNYVATPTSCGTGVCAREGQNICAAGNVHNTCAAGSPTGADTNCNGLDEDCDGTADDNYVATPTGCGIGVCAAAGQLICNAGQTQNTCQAGTPATETCNSLDDDCDGQADEGLTFDVDQDGYSTPGSCNGTRNDCDDNNAATHPGATELCNGVDDDCDSIIDETFTNKGQSCSAGVGVCQASGTYVCAANGQNTVCSATAGTPGTEVCDGGQLDEDCDGASNEDCNCVNGATQSCYSGPIGTGGTGTCHSGNQTCTAGNWGTCAGQVTPTTEACNGVDDDCDGQTDEGLGSTSCGQGVCAHTVQNCVGGQTQTCDAFQGATTESCNGLDDDCDGSTDETFTNKGQSCTVGLGVCLAGGTYVCSQDGQATVCNAVAGNQTGADNDCNGVDEDCDGTADDNYVATSTDCGTGACASIGQLICAAGQTQNTCQAGTPSVDTDCDGIDDDCDGSADEHYTATNTSCGTGVCAREGQNICVAGNTQNTCEAGGPTGADDDCNGLDEDCSGTADNNYVPTGTSCGTGVCSSLGLSICVSGSVQDTCVAGNQTGADDNCNGIDENCNGIADDNYQPAPTSCGTGVCATAGQLTCVSGQTQDTCAPTQPTGLDNDCNGIDEDCSGAADNNYVSTGTNCGTGVCAREGQLTCAFGQTQDNCQAGASTNETCNGLDDDCDGTTDEGCQCIDGATQPCYTGCSCTLGFGACHGGIQTCAQGVWGACIGEVTPVIEFCNGIDDDCDGHTDEFLGSTTCGQGACAHTVENCAFGQVQTCDPLQGASVELCDGVDNDCDGQTDETFTNKGQSCTLGLGVCQAGGTYVCAANGLSTVCDATAGNQTGADNDCNGVDENCDGTADDNYVANQTSCGVGACGRTGFMMCVGGQTLDTCQAGTPSNESCNSLDDDCDGQADETYNVGASCSAGVGQCARAGYLVCMEGGAACDAIAGTPSNESCDGFDNDCDGTVDEGCQCLDGATQPCYGGGNGTKGIGVCHGGIQTCVNGLWGACAGETLPAQESCNGVDDDCDGQKDEGIPCGSGGGGGGGAGYEVTNREYRIETEDRFPVATTLPAPTTTQPTVTPATLPETGSGKNPVESSGLVCPPTAETIPGMNGKAPVCEPANVPKITGYAIWPGDWMGLTGAWYARNFLILLILGAGYYVYAKDNERSLKTKKTGGQGAP